MNTTPSPAKRATIWEVAARAGVSGQTVSRYLRHDGQGMRELTRSRIEAAIAELDYQPNLAARAMRTRRTGRVAVLLPNGEATSAMRMLLGASEAARAEGRQADAVTMDGTAEERATRARELAESGLFEGMLILTALPPGSVPTTPGIPTVVSPDYDDELHTIGELADAAPIGALVEGLAALGHRDFVHIAGDRRYAAARDRERVYLESVRRLGLTSHEVLGGLDWDPETGRRAVLALDEDSPVTAVVAANDLMAAGAVHGAVERGWSIPGRLSVTGWDNNPLGAWLSPALTTVDVDYESLGQRAMGRLLDALRGAAPTALDGTVAAPVWRDTTGPAVGRTDH
ncbi:LacI family DNA-binding transcriptional regulator [Curtobacterium sp. PhB136]|uniref:LacI family DNA-binding transcriptional regulator n=1 Tax=Curtobacterium sp. PhB136 TaxID=2485181 RepID=UPI0010E1E861|nr:LacI family DNA-binding transcriptional regulator [Curtobacterium sp. PhB136]TCK59241.1 LacI family transcriptional regulator [Curtobacterium sp. PhB136]